jgi:hypothetical protein
VTPIKDALDRAAVRLLDDAHQRKDKTLVLLSDGEFENINPLFDPVRVADVLDIIMVRLYRLWFFDGVIGSYITRSIFPLPGRVFLKSSDG